MTINRRHFLAAPLVAQSAPPARVRSYREAVREVPIAGQADVVVCGAGPAGVVAALSAARSGARTLLIEWHGCLGGIWTAGMLSNIIDYQRQTGILPEILDRLKKRGAQIDPARYDVEAMKLVLEQMCLEAGVDVLLHTHVVAAAKDAKNRLSLVITENKSGRQAWEGKVFIDTTGDGDLAAAAGCRFEIGHPVTRETQPMTLMALVMGLNYPELNKLRLVRGDGVSSYTPPPRGVSSQEAKKNLLAEMRRAGVDPSYEGVTLFPTRMDLMALMANHEYGVSALDAKGISTATMRARQEVNQIVDALRSLGGPWKNIRLVATAEQIGVREGRRIRGRYTVTKEDLIRGARFDDAVCRVSFVVDIHSTNPARGKGVTSEGIKVKPYDVPLRSLIAEDVDGLLMAGRCISGDFFAHASYRVTGYSTAMGEAAGKVAATAAKTGRLPHQVPAREAGINPPA